MEVSRIAVLRVRCLTASLNLADGRCDFHTALQLANKLTAFIVYSRPSSNHQVRPSFDQRACAILSLPDPPRYADYAALATK